MIRLVLACFQALAAACNTGAPRASIVTTPANTTPYPAQSSQAATLSRFGAEKLMVLPLQRVAPDSAGWRALAVAQGDRAFAIRFDSTLERAFGATTSVPWSYASALSRAARRNPTYFTDPYAVRAAAPIAAWLKKQDEPLAEPFASQLRSLGGGVDARYALVPLDLRFERSTRGQIVAVLKLAVVDSRGSRVMWTGEVRGSEAAVYSFTVIEDLLQRAAELAAPR